WFAHQPKPPSVELNQASQLRLIAASTPPSESTSVGAIAAGLKLLGAYGNPRHVPAALQTPAPPSHGWPTSGEATAQVPSPRQVPVPHSVVEQLYGVPAHPPSSRQWS